MTRVSGITPPDHPVAKAAVAFAVQLLECVRTTMADCPEISEGMVFALAVESLVHAALDRGATPGQIYAGFSGAIGWAVSQLPDPKAALAVMLATAERCAAASVPAQTLHDTPPAGSS